MELCVGEIWGWGLIWRRCLAMHLFPLKDPDDEEEQENRGDAAWIAASIGAWCFHISLCGAWNPYILNQWLKVWRPWQHHSIRNIRRRQWLKDEWFNHQIEEIDTSRYVSAFLTVFFQFLRAYSEKTTVGLQLRRPRSGSAGFVAIDPWLVVDSWNQDSQGRWFGSRGRPVKDLESLNKHDVSHTISFNFLSLIPGIGMLGHVGTSTPGHFDDTSRFTSDDALRRWQPPFGWPHASSSLVEGRGIPKTARDLLYHKTAREWRVHPIMKLETYFYNLENLNHQFSINMQQGRGNLTATQGISFRARAQKTGEARWPRSTGLLIGLTTTPHEPFAKRKDKTKCSSLPAIDKAFILILICRLIYLTWFVQLLALLFQMLIYVPIAHPSSSCHSNMPGVSGILAAFFVIQLAASFVGCRIIPIKPNHYETPGFNFLALNNSENICWCWTFHVHQPADFCNHWFRMSWLWWSLNAQQHLRSTTSGPLPKLLKGSWRHILLDEKWWEGWLPIGIMYGMACLLCTRKASKYLRMLRPWSNDGN